MGKRKSQKRPQKKYRYQAFILEKGLCRLGEACKFDHGPDPIVLDDNNVSEFSTNPPPGVDVKRSTNGSNAPEYNPEAPGIATSTSRMPGFMPNFR